MSAPPLCPRCSKRPCTCTVPGQKSEEEKAYWRATAKDSYGVAVRLGQAARRRHGSHRYEDT